MPHPTCLSSFASPCNAVPPPKGVSHRDVGIDYVELRTISASHDVIQLLESHWLHHDAVVYLACYIALYLTHSVNCRSIQPPFFFFRGAEWGKSRKQIFTLMHEDSLHNRHPLPGLVRVMAFAESNLSFVTLPFLNSLLGRKSLAIENVKTTLLDRLWYSYSSLCAFMGIREIRLGKNQEPKGL
jgi:hypothetical protein